MLRTCSRMAVLRDGKKVGELSGDELSQEGNYESSRRVMEMSNTKSTLKKITSMRLFMPIVCLLAVLLINVITTPDFSRVSINNGYYMDIS